MKKTLFLSLIIATLCQPALADDEPMLRRMPTFVMDLAKSRQFMNIKAIADKLHEPELFEQFKDKPHSLYRLPKDSSARVHGFKTMQYRTLTVLDSRGTHTSGTLSIGLDEINCPDEYWYEHTLKRLEIPFTSGKKFPPPPAFIINPPDGSMDNLVSDTASTPPQKQELLTEFIIKSQADQEVTLTIDPNSCSVEIQSWWTLQ